MVKGVKKIKWTGNGKVISHLSVPNKKVVIAGDQEVYFEVDLWYEGTTEADKKKDITWILQNRKKNTIIVQKIHSANAPQRISIPNALCGPFEYYVEASLSGKRDLINQTGLVVRGHCPAKIVSSKWCTTNDGKDVGKEHLFKYGETIYLNLMTEGLNGNLNLTVDVFRKSGDGKIPLHRYTSVDVIDGEINLALKNTFSWYPKLMGIKETEEFYVKVFDPAIKLYIANGKDETKQGCYLKINKKIGSQEITRSTNLSPLKTGVSDQNKERYELCRFEMINITENKKTPTRVFDNGENLIKVSNPKTPILKTILFDFEKHDITTEAKTILNNVLQYLLGSQHSYIKIDGHACVIGKEQYNQKLSQQRSDAVKKAFIDGGLDGSRIVSIGRGEVNPTDDKNGRDNIKHKNEKEYIENRRVDITFDSYGHNAQTIIYETIAKSQNQNYTIDITEYQNKAYFKEVKHKKNIKINSPEYSTAMDQVTSKLDFPVKSNLNQFNLFPLKYIWPKVFANQYDIHAHSCRYFSVDSTPTVRVMAYPDIKWDFHFFLNLSNELSVKWKDLPPGKDTEMRKKAGKIGAEKRWKQTEIDFGVVLEANWNKIDGDKYEQHFDATLKYEAKIKQLYSVFSSLKEFSKGITGGTAGVAKKSSLPFDVQIKPPNFCLGAIWQLAQGNNDNIATNVLGMKYTFYFKAEPLIALVLTIDLLDLVAQTVGTVFGGPAGNKAAKKILDLIREWAEKDRDLGITFKILFDLIITGQIDGEADMTINTALKDNNGKAELKNKLSAEIKLEVELKAKAVILEVTAYAAGIAKASGKASVMFGHTLQYNQTQHTLFYRPQINFDAVKGRVLVKIEAGISAKKLNLDFKKDRVLVDENYEFWRGFDVIECLEKTTHISANINLI